VDEAKRNVQKREQDARNADRARQAAKRALEAIRRS
jgi:hypothetical protein